MIAGNAWKVEGVLAAFYARHLRPALGGSHQTLVSGLASSRGRCSRYSIQSLDWFRPTFGELGMPAAVPRAHSGSSRSGNGPKRHAVPTSTASASPGSTSFSRSPRSTPASVRSRWRT